MDSQKKIIFITPGLGKGGAETQLVRVAKFLKTKNFNVLIISLNHINDFKTEDLQVITFKSGKKHLVQNIRSLYKVIADFKPEVVVAFMFSAIICARILKLTFKYYLISCVRNSEISNRWKLLFKATKNLDDVVTYNALHSKTNLEQMGIVKPGGIVIPNVVRVPLTVTHTKNNIFTWLCVAHFRNSKDYETLFKAIYLIKDNKFIVNIIGNVHGQTWPFETVKNLGIEDHVNILGFLSEPEPYFHSADAFVLSSKWEGSPNAMLEAMASERLVVGSDIGGIRELISESDCGILFKQGDEHQLAAAMVKVMNIAEDELKLAGDNGRKYIINNFSEQVILHKWEDIILKRFNPVKN